MSPAHVLEPTYDTLRRRLVAGDWPPRCRLEAARLAEELGVSITPVRDALNRLTGEPELPEIGSHRRELQPLPGHRRGQLDQLTQAVDDLRPVLAQKRLLEPLDKPQGGNVASRFAALARGYRHAISRIFLTILA